MLTQQCLLPPLTSTVKSSLFTHSPVHSPWLPGYMDATQTILVVLTMAGNFPDRPLYVCLMQLKSEVMRKTKFGTVFTYK